MDTSDKVALAGLGALAYLMFVHKGNLTFIGNPAGGGGDGGGDDTGKRAVLNLADQLQYTGDEMPEKPRPLTQTERLLKGVKHITLDLFSGKRYSRVTDDVTFNVIIDAGHDCQSNGAGYDATEMYLYNGYKKEWEEKFKERGYSVDLYKFFPTEVEYTRVYAQKMRYWIDPDYIVEPTNPRGKKVKGQGLTAIENEYNVKFVTVDGIRRPFEVKTLSGPDSLLMAQYMNTHHNGAKLLITNPKEYWRLFNDPDERLKARAEYSLKPMLLQIYSRAKMPLVFVVSFHMNAVEGNWNAWGTRIFHTSRNLPWKENSIKFAYKIAEILRWIYRKDKQMVRFLNDFPLYLSRPIDVYPTQSNYCPIAFWLLDQDYIPKEWVQTKEVYYVPVLIECAFIKSKKDFPILSYVGFMNAVCKSVAIAIERTLEDSHI